MRSQDYDTIFRIESAANIMIPESGLHQRTASGFRIAPGDSIMIQESGLHPGQHHDTGIRIAPESRTWF